MADFKVTRTIKYTWIVEAENSTDALNQALGFSDESQAECENNWKTKKVISKE